MPVVPWVKKQGLFDAKVLAAHCVHVDDGEMRALKNFGAGRGAQPDEQPEAGRRRGAGVRMRELGLHVGIGTDGPASNNDLDMFEETRLAALLAKGIGGDPTALPAREALAMATRLGACALHMDHLTGSLEPGKRADLIVLDLGPTHNVPAFARDRRHLRADRVRGEVHRRRGRDVQRALADARPRAADARRAGAARGGARAGGADRRVPQGREISVLQKLVAIGGAVEQESFEVQVKALIGTAAGARRAEQRRADGDPREPLPPARHLLVVRGSGAGAPALPRGRVPRRGGRGDRARAAG
jgi:5-methylthioadenosine/S-adenosylhomocysteine deaminase